MKNTIINALWRILGIAALSVIAPSAFAYGAIAFGTDAGNPEDTSGRVTIPAETFPDGMRFRDWFSSTNQPSQAAADAAAMSRCENARSFQSGECTVMLRFKDAAYVLVHGRTSTTMTMTLTMTIGNSVETLVRERPLRSKNDGIYYRRTTNAPSARAELLAQCQREHATCTARWSTIVDGTESANLFSVPSGKSNSDSTGKRLAIAAGGAAAAGAVAWIFSGSSGFADASSFSPVAEYSYDDGLRRYQVGTRLDWQNDKWSAYWKATKSSNIGKTDGFAFGSGAKWTGDIFSAAFNTSAIGDNSENNLSLSAKRIFGLWTLSPEYRLDYRTSKIDKTLLHALSANAVWQGDKWTVSHSLGFHGESLAAFGDNASAKIKLRREF